MKNFKLFLSCYAIFLFSQIQAQTSQPYNWKNVQIVGGGFVPGIVYNESEAELVYARTDIGGAYRMDPATNRWIPLTDWIGWNDWGLTGIISLATDAIDPNNNSILYLGAPSGNGLWKSTNYGVNWTKVTSFPTGGTYVEDPNDVNGYLNDIQGIVWITFDKRTGTAGNTTQTIYAGVADKGNSIYRSTDAGATWSALVGQPTGYVPHKGKLDEVNGYLYVAYSD